MGRAPEWGRLDGVLPELALSGFENAATGLTLLFARPVAEDETEYPYARLLHSLDFELPPPDKESAALVHAASVAAGLLSDEWYGTDVVQPALHIALALHRALGQPLFYFAADDEGLNLGLLAEKGGLAKLVFHGPEGMAELVDGKIVMQPIEIEGEESFLDLDELAEELGEIPALEVKPLLSLEDDERRYLHSSAIQAWPKEWPSPAGILGLGTWDAWSKFDETFTSVYQRR